MADRDAAYIGLDVGGTFLKGARIDGTGRILTRLHEPIRKSTGREILDQFASAVEALETKGGPCVAVGVGLPGIIEMTKGRVRGAPNVPVIDGLKVGEELETRTGRASFVENDANAAALAEAWLGAGRGGHDVLYVTLGTGSGRRAGLRRTHLDGAQRVRGRDRAHPGRPRRPAVRLRLVGLPGDDRRHPGLDAARGGAAGRGAAVHAGRPSPLDPQAIVEAARGEDAVALEVVDGAARAVGIGIAAVLDLLNVDRVVLGGGVANAGFFLLERIVEEARKRTFPHVFADVTFRLAELGSDAGVVGAARVGMLGAGNA